jgi:hypothetical protein
MGDPEQSTKAHAVGASEHGCIWKPSGWLAHREDELGRLQNARRRLRAGRGGNERAGERNCERVASPALRWCLELVHGRHEWKIRAADGGSADLETVGRTRKSLESLAVERRETRLRPASPRAHFSLN